MTRPRTLQLQGSTGTIGANTLSVVREHMDKFKVKTLIAQSNWRKLAEQALEFGAENVVIEDNSYFQDLYGLLKNSSTKVFSGRKAMVEMAAEPHDITIAGISGVAALEPIAAAVRSSKLVGLANKESIICASEIILSIAKQHKTTIIPVDSEHSAIFQCMEPKHNEILNIVLTASGGPFRTRSLVEMESVTPDEAIRHPNWRMGGKISVDSATLMNKGLEVIEACKLFNLPTKQVHVVIHPESIIHGFINYCDGSTIAQMSNPDMRVPISYALFYPHRQKLTHKALNLADLGKLTFEEPDYTRFPLLALAMELAGKSQAEIVALNVANEVAVGQFLSKKIKFLDIQRMVIDAITNFTPVTLHSIEDTVALVEELKLQYSSDNL